MGKPLKLEDLERFPHVAISIFGDGQSEMNTMLAARGLSRHVGLTTPYFMLALATVAETDHVATVSEALARRFAPEFDLVLTPSQLIAEPMTLTLVWDHVRSGDPALGWFRNLLREIARRVYQST
ncbi:LysR substrate-binding domain-containing protein [Bradyrhizobium sp. Arg237L]|uniref:LysR substrate-binding domain-containing protein n=1 Tax=Bradyrhizobium sp. Arg237L TaxID=3003352 RepID=UPI00249F691E|nr:LysR substrate-binding domain-containing protein [Bradyrhizobium sp. Arg237L]MDI4231962.1 LysR substrate-binding domain-containing protein [Bradyrhizobium sp. Arg237L]